MTSFEAAEMTRPTAIAITSERWREGERSIICARSSLLAAPSAAETWPAGSERAISKA